MFKPTHDQAMILFFSFCLGSLFLTALSMMVVLINDGHI